MSRSLLRLSARALVVASVLLVAGCSAAEDSGEVDELGESEDLVTGKDTTGIVAGSPEEAAILLVANDRALTATRLTGEVKITATAKNALVSFRAGPTADPSDDGYVLTLADLDKLKGTTKTFYSRVLTFAKARDYVDSGAVVAPDRALFEVPDNLGRPPTSADVRVVKGFDGRTPDEAYAIVRSRAAQFIHPQNERLLRETFDISHKAFNVALGNFFAEGSPPMRFLKGLGPVKANLLGLLRQLTPVALEITLPDGRVEYYMNTTGTYQKVTKPTQQVIMRSAVSLDPPGVRVFYPQYRQSNLTAPTSTVVEGGG